GSGPAVPPPPFRPAALRRHRRRCGSVRGGSAGCAIADWAAAYAPSRTDRLHLRDPSHAIARAWRCCRTAAKAVSKVGPKPAPAPAKAPATAAEYSRIFLFQAYGTHHNHQRRQDTAPVELFAKEYPAQQNREQHAGLPQ